MAFQNIHVKKLSSHARGEVASINHHLYRGGVFGRDGRHVTGRHKFYGVKSKP